MATIDEVFQHLRDNPTPITDFEYTEYEDYVTLDDYIGSSIEVYIPSEINGKEVRISNAARLNNTIITVIIPDTITNIYNLLISCSNLKNLSIPCSTQYYWNSFPDNLSLKNIIISKGTGVMRNYIPTETHPDIGPFGYIYTPWYRSQNTIENIKLEKGIKIGQAAFYKSTLFTELDFDELEINELHGSAFGHSTLKKIKFSNPVMYIGDGDFTDANLTEIDFNNTNLVYYNISQYKDIPSGTFTDCNSLTEITIPGSIKVIPEKCFSNCINLETIIINDGVEEIGKEAFSGCEKLSNISLPVSLKKLGMRALNNCPSLIEVTISEQVESLNRMFDNSTNLKKLTVLNPNCKISVIAPNEPSNLEIYGHISFAEEAKKYTNSTFTLINTESDSPIEDRPADIEGGIPSAKLFKFGLNLGDDDIENSQIGFVITVDNNPTIDNLIVPGSNGEVTSISTSSLFQIEEPLVKTFTIINYKIENQILYANAAITNIPEEPGYIHVTAYINQDNQGYYYTDILTYPTYK